MKLMRKIRKDKKMTQKELAKISGVAVATIYMFETDKIKELNMKSLSKLAKALGTTEEELCQDYREKRLKVKKCLNQGCLLNHDKKCQSDQVCNGEYCQNEHLVTPKRKKDKYKFNINI